MSEAGPGQWALAGARRSVATMKALLKLAFAGAVAYLAVRIARQWQLDESDSVPTLNPPEDADAFATEPLQPEDLRVAQNSPL